MVHKISVLIRSLENYSMYIQQEKLRSVNNIQLFFGNHHKRIRISHGIEVIRFDVLVKMMGNAGIEMRRIHPTTFNDAMDLITNGDLILWHCIRLGFSSSENAHSILVIFC